MWQKWLKRSCLGLIAFQAVALHGMGILEGVYVKAGLGLTFVRHASANCAASDEVTTVAASKVRVDNSSPWIFAIGYNWNEHWRTEVSSNIRPHIDYRLKNDTGDRSKGRLKSIATCFNAFYDFDRMDTIIPYAGAGVGVASNKTKTAKWSSVSQGGLKVNSLTWNFTLGLREEVSKGFWVDGAWRFNCLGKFRTKGQFSDGTNGASTNFKPLYAHDIVITLSYYL